MPRRNSAPPEKCPVCLDEVKAKCVTICNHCFCQDCILKVFMAERLKLCPLCRHSLHLRDVLSVATFTSLRMILNLKIIGGVYVQNNTIGLASYHFDSESDCYISYKDIQCNFWELLDDDTRVPIKKSFVNVKVDEKLKIFRGDIVWAPTSWEGDVLWRYEMHFAEDYDVIVSGTCVRYDAVENGIVKGIKLFGEDVEYKRYFRKDLPHLFK